MKTEWCEVIIGILILVFNYFSWYSKTIIIILGVVLIVHAFMCRKCNLCCDCEECEMPVKKARKK